MNIVLLGHDDIASKIAIQLTVAALPDHCFKLFLSGAVSAGNNESPSALDELSRLDRIFYESLPWGIAGDPEELAAPNSPDGLAALAACDPDLIISARYRRILKSAAIRLPQHGVLNLHSGLLPDYKGVMATFWAMLNGERTIGCTLHRIVDGTIDTGPIIGLSNIPTRNDWSYLTNVLELYPAGCRMMVDAVRKISSGEAVEMSKQAGAGHYYSMPTARDLEQFFTRGLHLVDESDLEAFLGRHRLA